MIPSNAKQRKFWEPKSGKVVLRILSESLYSHTRVHKLPSCPASIIKPVERYYYNAVVRGSNQPQVISVPEDLEKKIAESFSAICDIIVASSNQAAIDRQFLDECEAERHLPKKVEYRTLDDDWKVSRETL